MGLDVIGILLILGALGGAFVWILGGRSHKGWAFTLCLVSIFVGAFLIMQERVTELTVKGVGTMKTVVEQARADATAIADLKARADAQSATIDLVAKDAAEAKQLAKDLSERNSTAEEKISQLDKSIAAGSHIAEELQLYTKFNTTILAAQNNDRQAYDRLWGWSEDNSFPFQKIAAQAVQTIMDQHNPAMVRGGFKIPWKQEVDPQKFSLSELQYSFNGAPPHIRVAILEFVWEKRSDIPKKDKLNFLVEVIKNDNNLQVIEYAGRYFSQGTNDGFKPIAIIAHLEWWDKNKDSIKLDDV